MVDGIFVGLDLGTGGARALAVDARGTVLARAGVDLPANATRREGERVEQDPRAWRRAAGGALRALVADLPVPAAITAVAVDATSGSFLLTDADGKPLTPGIMYSDLRGAGTTREAAAALAADLAPYGIAIAPSFAIGKALHLLRADPELPRRWRRLVHQTDWIVAQLCGRLDVTDVSTALKTGVDPERLDWPAALAEKLGLPRDRLPAVLLPGRELGRVDARGHASTGLPVGTLVVAGCTDGTAGCLASGACRTGAVNVTLGTTLTFKAVSERPLRDEAGAIYNHRHPDGGYLPGAASNTGGEWIGRCFPDADPAALDQEVADLVPGGRIAYPLEREGERFPFADASARGFGLAGIADERERFLAGLEGTAYLERLGLERLAACGLQLVGPIHATGKGARSGLWSRIRAACCERPVTIPRETECALGAAILAATPHLGSVAAATAALVHPATTVDPQPTLVTAYKERYAAFRAALRERGYA